MIDSVEDRLEVLHAGMPFVIRCSALWNVRCTCFFVLGEVRKIFVDLPGLLDRDLLVAGVHVDTLAAADSTRHKVPDDCHGEHDADHPEREG